MFGTARGAMVALALVVLFPMPGGGMRVAAAPRAGGAARLSQAQKPRAKTPPKAAAALSAATSAVQKAVSVKELERSLGALNFERTTGKEGERKAAAFVEQRLREYGVKYNRQDVRALVSWPVKAEISLFGEATGSMRAVTAAFAAATPPGGLTAEAVMLPAPIDERGIGQDVRGKIAVVPGQMTPESVSRAQRSAAVGLIFVNEGDVLRESSASPVWGTPTPETRALMPRLPVISVSKGSGDRLRSALSRGPVAVKIVADVQQQWTTVPLIVADIPGAGPDFVLVTAHLDAWYEGMTDGATGVAAALEIARVLQPQRAKLRRGVRLAFWGGQKAASFAGSTWYADRNWNELDKLCVAYTNMQGIGRRGMRLDAVDAGGWPSVAEFSRQVGKTLSGTAVAVDRGARPTREADSSFQGIGVSEFWAGAAPPAKPGGEFDAGGRARYWHTRDDKLDRVDLKVLTLDTQYRAAAVFELAQAPVVPLQVAPAAATLARAIDDVAATAGNRLDLSGPRAAAAALVAAASKIDAAPRPSRPDAVAAFNRLLIRASHRLDSALYARSGLFAQDPIGDLPVLPLLADARALAAMPADSDDAAYLETALVRARNALELLIRDVTDDLNALLGVRTT